MNKPDLSLCTEFREDSCVVCLVDRNDLVNTDFLDISSVAVAVT